MYLTLNKAIRTERDLNSEIDKTIPHRKPLNMLLPETIFLGAIQVQASGSCWKLSIRVEETLMFLRNYVKL